MWGNCLLFALYMRLRFGGQLLWRWSWYYHGPHVYWRSRCGRYVADYVPIKKRLGRGGRKRWFPRPFFRGRIRLVVIGEEQLG